MSTAWALGIKSSSARTNHLLFKTINFGHANAWMFITLIVINSIAYSIIDGLSHSLFHILIEHVYVLLFLSSHFLYLSKKLPGVNGSIS